MPERSRPAGRQTVLLLCLCRTRCLPCEMQRLLSRSDNWILLYTGPGWAGTGRDGQGRAGAGRSGAGKSGQAERIRLACLD